MQLVFTILSVDTCNNSRGSFWSDLEFENISIGIEHKMKKVFVSYHLLDKNTSLISFRSDDGFPISILIESFLVFDIQCVHKIKNKIRVPIESGCKWKLLGGMSEGAFKSNGGLDTRYSDIFHDSNCAVYYPPRGGFDKTIETKKITIQLSVYPFVLNHQNGNPPSSDEVGLIGTINTSFINSLVVRNYFLEITLKRWVDFLTEILMKSNWNVKVSMMGSIVGINRRKRLLWRQHCQNAMKMIVIPTLSCCQTRIFSTPHLIPRSKVVSYAT